MSGISLKHITKQFSNTIALSNVSLEIPQGSIYGLLGPNGAGKTTCIRIITQILHADTGSIELFEKPLTPNDVQIMGYLPEERGLYKNMFVGEQIMYFASLKGMSNNDAKKECTTWLQKFEIEHWKHKKASELSKGMQQKIQFICSVIHKPQVLILDEPFSGFDPINAEHIKQEILELKKQGATIVLSTHNMNSVEELCDSIALIHKSHKILEGTVSHIQSQYAKNSYRISFNGYYDSFLATLTTSYKLVEQTKTNDITTITIELTEDIVSNALLKHVMTFGNIIEFKQLIPSMNEIFIHAVQNSSTL